MIRRTVEISRSPCHIAVRDGQLLILRRDVPPRPLSAHPPNLAASIPLEDLGLLVVDERDTTYSHAALAQLAELGCALVICGRNHAPTGLFLPLSSHTQVYARFQAQLSASRPTCKRLWSSIVVAKIKAQATNLAHASAARSKVLALARRVKSGDPENVEAQAARLYWPALFGDLPTLSHPFRRRPADPSSPPPNNLLDYGYAVLRAATARALVSAGLLPMLGIQHHNRSNALCLADDLVEPFRPLIDARVRALASQSRFSLDQPTKAHLLSVLTDTVTSEGRSGPLQVALAGYVASFARALEGDATCLAIPVAAEPPSPGPAANGAGPFDSEDEHEWT